MNLTLKKSVNAPIDKVFNVFSDFSTAAERVKGIESVEILTDGPIAKGTRFTETRIMFGKSSTEEMEITEFELNKRYTVEADSCGAHFQTEFRFEPNGVTTNVEMEMNTRNVTLLAKLMSPLGFLMAGTMKKMIETDMDQLKSYCEQVE